MVAGVAVPLSRFERGELMPADAVDAVDSCERRRESWSEGGKAGEGQGGRTAVRSTAETRFGAPFQRCWLTRGDEVVPGAQKDLQTLS